MKSTYAPLPFSYLSSDAKPKVGLRKDGVYGTSADFVPRSTNQVEGGADAGDISMATQYPYSVYANANALNPEGTAAADHRGNQHQHQQTADHHSPYSQNGAGLPRFQEATSHTHRPQKPEGGFKVYPPSSKYDEPPSSGRVSPKEVDLERKGDHGYRGLPVVKRQHEQLDRSNAAVGRVPSYYPPVGNNFDRQVNGVESPYTYTLEHPKEKHQPTTTTTAVMAKDFDNFILVKDPNRPDSVVVIPEANPPPSSANNDPRRNNNLQTLFEAGEPPRKQQLPRYNTQQQPENHYDISGPSRGEESNARHNQEVSDRSNYAIYHGHAQQPGPEFVTAATTKPEPPIYNGSAGVMQPDNHHRSSDTRLVKDSDSGSSSTSGCCVCGKCASVIIAIIVTAIICLGAGFVAGWFGARATGNNTSTDSSPSQLIFANLSTVTTTTTTMAERVSTTKPSVTSSNKASAILSSSKLLAISSAKAQLVTSTIERRAAISTTVRSGQ